MSFHVHMTNVVSPSYRTGRPPDVSRSNEYYVVYKQFLVYSSMADFHVLETTKCRNYLFRKRRVASILLRADQRPISVGVYQN